MRDVDLLGPGGAGIAKSLQQIGGQSLKSSERLGLSAVKEVVVDGEVLVVVDVVIQPHRELVVLLTAVGDRLVNIGNGIEYVVGMIWSRHELLDQIQRYRVKTRSWDLTVWTKNRGVGIAN